MTTIRGYLTCWDCGNTGLRLEYREYIVTDTKVEVIDHFRCDYCYHYARIPLERNLEDVAKALEKE